MESIKDAHKPSTKPIKKVSIENWFEETEEEAEWNDETNMELPNCTFVSATLPKTVMTYLKSEFPTMQYVISQGIHKALPKSTQ